MLAGVCVVVLLGVLVGAPLAVFALKRAADTVRRDTLFPSGLNDPAPTSTRYDSSNHLAVPLGEISPYLRKAVLASEDRRFKTFPAVDPIGVLRAAYADLSTGTFDQGGSTLTEQLMKDLFIKPAVRDDKQLARRLAEAVLAVQYARSHTRSQILRNYLNTVYFGNGAYGVESAARFYFGVSASQLDPAQAATLAGLIRAPSTLNPLANPKAAIKQRDIVLKTMLDQGLISKARYEGTVTRSLGVFVRARP